MMTSAEYPSTDRFGILFVCTGNQCRSPVAEVLARRLLDQRFGPEHAARFDVSSAGTQAALGGTVFLISLQVVLVVLMGSRRTGRECSSR